MRSAHRKQQGEGGMTRRMPRTGSGTPFAAAHPLNERTKRCAS